MAQSASSYFNNAIVGVPQVGADVNPFDMHNSPKFALGTKFEAQDGSVYRYSQFGANVNRGILVAQDLSETGVVETAAIVVDTNSAQAVPNETITAGNIGSNYLEVTKASVTADDYAGGYLSIMNGGGEGFSYRIRGNTATDTPATGNFRLELYDKIQASVGAATSIGVLGSLYSNLEGAVAASDVAVAGVTVNQIVVATAAYGWIKSKGPVTVLLDTTEPAIGDMVTLSDDTTGAVQAMGGGDLISTAAIIGEGFLGICAIAGSSTGHGVVLLQSLD